MSVRLPTRARDRTRDHVPREHRHRRTCATRANCRVLQRPAEPSSPGEPRMTAGQSGHRMPPPCRGCSEPSCISLGQADVWPWSRPAPQTSFASRAPSHSVTRRVVRRCAPGSDVLERRSPLAHLIPQGRGQSAENLDPQVESTLLDRLQALHGGENLVVGRRDG